MLKGKMQSIVFALVVCVIASVLLSGAASALKPRQEKNVELDIKKNILKALAISDQGDLSGEEAVAYYAGLNNEKIESLYSSNVKELVVNKEGEIQEGQSPVDLPDNSPLLPAYEKVDDQGNVLAYAIPIQGKGLWSTIKGYLALEKDLNTVLGITFYSQGETAGLGAEVAEPWFQENYKGKKILDDSGNIESVTIIKGKVDASTPNAQHKVDGISGATMTGNGVNQFLEKDLKSYKEFFEKMRAQNG